MRRGAAVESGEFNDTYLARRWGRQLEPHFVGVVKVIAAAPTGNAGWLINIQRWGETVTDPGIYVSAVPGYSPSVGDTVLCHWQNGGPRGFVVCPVSAASGQFKTFTRSMQSVAYAATITIDASLGDIVTIGTLTGALTLAAPTNPAKGQELSIAFLQDATGGRVVTWNAVFKLGTFAIGAAANARTVADLYYDGTNWISHRQ